jgi:hypothetical protein
MEVTVWCDEVCCTISYFVFNDNPANESRSVLLNGSSFCSSKLVVSTMLNIAASGRCLVAKSWEMGVEYSQNHEGLKATKISCRMGRLYGDW